MPIPIVNSLLTWIMKKRLHQIELFKKYPNEVQQEWFTNLINAAAGTEWGRTYGYNSINSVNDYVNRVPLQSYDSLQPYIQRMLQGQQNVLWGSDVKWFAKSSGTTGGGAKFIPVSEECLQECHFKGGKDMLALYCENNPNAQLFMGKSLVLGGSHQINQFGGNSWYGDLSAVLIKNLPAWAEFYRTPGMDIALMPDYEEKIKRMARVTSTENITSISGVPTWTIVLAKEILAITGAANLREVWPNLEVYFHGAVSFQPYRQQFSQLIPGSGMHYMETYNASEGFFGIQDQLNSDELLLMLDYGIFYEFVPLEEVGNANPQTLQLSQVQLHKNYALVITTNTGLWRYMVGDTVRFTSLLPYRIKITGRTKHFINAFGEEVIIDNAEGALQQACLATGATVKDYTAGPVYFSGNAAGSHQWIIEFETPPQNQQLFNQVLDNSLRQINTDYDAKRYKDMALTAPQVIIAPPNTFYNWLKAQNKLGGQHKVPRLANNREYLEAILAMLNNGTS